MNLSGEAVQGLAYSHRVSSTDILVICDDMDLPLGNIRIRAKGSSGGHKGLQSIIERLGTQEFPRIRVGIGRDAERDAVDYVLSRFSQEEEQVVAKVVKQVGEAVQLVVQGELEAAMNRFNRRVAQ
jgi:PTH1 family peptidyl-tRNA hydrolase